VVTDVNIVNQLIVPPSNAAIKLVSCKHANSQAITEVIDLTNKPYPVIFSTAFTYDAPGSAVSGQSYKLKWDTNRTNIIYDDTGKVAEAADGTTRATSILVPELSHLSSSGVCTTYSAGTALGWDPTMICNAGVTGRTITFSRAVPANMRRNTDGATLKVYPLTTANEDLSAVTSGFSTINDQGGKWSVPLLASKLYAVWWDADVDFRNLTITRSQFYRDDNHDAIILRFNYTEKKEIIEVGDYVGGWLTPPFKTASGSMLSVTTCDFGRYYHDAVNKYIYVCVSDKATSVDSIQVNPLNCVNFCNDTTNNIVKEDFVRNWNNASQWPGTANPVAGANVTIPAEWTVKLDVDPPALGSLIVEGNLFVEGRDAALDVGFMWVKGTFWAGNASVPFTNALSITVAGNRTSQNFTFGDQSANKLIVVTGRMTLYGDYQGQQFYNLAAKVDANSANPISLDTSTIVADANDQFVITPSFSNPTQYSFTLAGTLSSTTFIPETNNKPTNTHFGDAASTSSIDANAETRSAVLHLTRKIKIISGTNSDNYGFRVLVTSVNGSKGSITFNGV